MLFSQLGGIIYFPDVIALLTGAVNPGEFEFLRGILGHCLSVFVVLL